jgi:hypothetical protein
MRCAIVGPSDRTREMKDFLSLPADREVQRFEPAQEQEAWRWFKATEIVEKV